MMYVEDYTGSFDVVLRVALEEFPRSYFSDDPKDDERMVYRVVFYGLDLEEPHVRLKTLNMK